MPCVALKVPETYFTASTAGDHDEYFRTNCAVLGVLRMKVMARRIAEAQNMRVLANRRCLRRRVCVDLTFCRRNSSASSSPIAVESSLEATFSYVGLVSLIVEFQWLQAKHKGVYSCRLQRRQRMLDDSKIS